MRSLLLLACLLGPFSATLCQEQPAFSLQFIFAFGSEGLQPQQFRSPLGISIDPEGNIYVADTGNNRLQKFNNRGTFLKEVGGFGWETTQFDRPVDVCAKTGLDVFVADYNNERIERYDKDLNYISSYYPDESQAQDLRFGFPLSIEISDHGELFIVDGENFRILKINSFGEAELSFGDYRWGDGKLDRPYQIEVTSGDAIYVSDIAANRIIAYDYFGNYTQQLGVTLLRTPTGISSDDKGNIWVADTGNNRIILFSPQGRILLTWGIAGDTPGAFLRPADVAAGDGRVYVLDAGNCRVQVFEITYR